MNYLEIDLGGGEPLIVEHEGGDEIVEASRLGDVALRGIQTFDGAMDSLRDAAEVAVARVTNLACRPDQVTVEFSVQLGCPPDRPGLGRRAVLHTYDPPPLPDRPGQDGLGGPRDRRLRRAPAH